jgi:hypothetical protein
MYTIPSGNRVLVWQFMDDHRSWDWDFLIKANRKCRSISTKKGEHYTKLRKYKELYKEIENTMGTLDFNKVVGALIEFIKHYNLQKSKKKEFVEYKVDNYYISSRNCMIYTFRINYADSTYKLIEKIDKKRGIIG